MRLSVERIMMNPHHHGPIPDEGGFGWHENSEGCRDPVPALHSTRPGESASAPEADSPGRVPCCKLRVRLSVCVAGWLLACLATCLLA